METLYGLIISILRLLLMDVQILYVNYNPATVMMVLVLVVLQMTMFVMYDSFGDGWNGNVFTIGTETTLGSGSLDTIFLYF